mmetsp:Transcript_5779/g.10348  ORF Transcript_5779/g.10348 Transcript_5779/m.10348 type:complete len:475 (+) Transcript_5779:427-1851(+)
MDFYTPLVEPLTVPEVSDWGPNELEALHKAVEKHGLRWRAVALELGSGKGWRECRERYWTEVRNQRIAGQQSRVWSLEDVVALHDAVRTFGNSWHTVSLVVGTYSPKQCCKKAWKEIHAGLMKDPAIGVSSTRWTSHELKRLSDALNDGGLDWVSVTRDRDWERIAAYVGSRSALDCMHKARVEVFSNRFPYTEEMLLANQGDASPPVSFDMENEDNDESDEEDLATDSSDRPQDVNFPLPLMEVPSEGQHYHLVPQTLTSPPPPPPPPPPSGLITVGANSVPGLSRGTGEGTTARAWSTEQISCLHEAVARFGRNWAQVSTFIEQRTGAKWTGKECCRKVWKECKSGRMREPPGKQAQERWGPEETARLKEAVSKFGRNWEDVRKHVGNNRTVSEIRNKTLREVAAGRMEEPRKLKRSRENTHWSETELVIADGLTALGALGYDSKKTRKGANSTEKARASGKKAKNENSQGI